MERVSEWEMGAMRHNGRAVGVWVVTKRRAVKGDRRERG